MTEKEVWDKAYKRIFELYGDMPDLRIVSRFYSEKQAFMPYEVGKYFYDLEIGVNDDRFTVMRGILELVQDVTL